MFKFLSRIVAYSLLLALFINPAHAASFPVTNTNDSGAGSLRQVIADTNTNPGADSIYFDASVTGTITLTSGQINITDELTIDGRTNNITIDANNNSRIFYANATAPLTVSNLTFINSISSINSSSYVGAILTTADLTVNNSTFRNNNASAIWGGNVAITVNDSLFENNVSNTIGGAISNGTQFSTNLTTINRSTFIGNSARQFGGAIFATNVAINDSLFLNNGGDTTVGGAVSAYGGTTEITNSLFSGNRANYGGAFINSIYGTMTGGTTITNSTFDNNSTVNGGSAAIQFNDNAVINIVNSTFANHTGVASVIVKNSYGNGLNIVNSSFINNNDSGYTGSVTGRRMIGVRGDLGLTSNLFVNNQFSFNGDTSQTRLCRMDDSQTLTTANNLYPSNNFVDAQGCDFTAGTDNVEIPAATVSTTVVSAPADNGCATQVGQPGHASTACLPTTALVGGSPAINVGANPNGLTTDTRGTGFPRVFAGQADIGAYESQVFNYTVGGSVSGLTTGNSVVLQNNGGDDLTVNANGNFTFATAIADGGAYAVTVATQPTGQTCTVSNPSGNVNGANVSNVAVTCTTNTYNVGGSVSGLNGTVVLQNNGGDDLSVNANGTFTFATAIASGSAYAVTVATQPTGQTCTVSNGSGTATANVTNVQVTCATNTYTIGGNVSGLSGSVTLQNNGGDDITMTADGTFTFATAIAGGSAYAVTVAAQPTGQTCTVSNGSGTATANVTNVQVTCAAVPSYTVGGTISGLSGTIVLQNNGGDDLTLSTDGPFTFLTALLDGTAYNITILTPPAGQSCTISNGSGTVSGGNIGNIQISCRATTVAPVPTINAYGILLMLLAMLGVAWFGVRRS